MIRAGVECKDCHMPKTKDKKGKIFTFHGQRSARYMLRDTCVRCHKYWTQEEAEYQVEAIQNYIRGKMRKAEFWLGQLIESYTRAKDLGVGEETLKEVRSFHDKAHILWEWWTAENSDGFHNPALARESLTASIAASKKGVEVLNKALNPPGTQNSNGDTSRTSDRPHPDGRLTTGFSGRLFRVGPDTGLAGFIPLPALASAMVRFTAALLVSGGVEATTRRTLSGAIRAPATAAGAAGMSARAPA